MRPFDREEPREAMGEARGPFGPGVSMPGSTFSRNPNWQRIFRRGARLYSCEEG